jgi:NAD(P)-dependent dehydrogenase (short-subunit alcohol dehydrogenase family)
VARPDPEARAVALVTGAKRGIGLKVCRQLARQGYAALLGSRDAATGERAARELAQGGLTVRACQLDGPIPRASSASARGSPPTSGSSTRSSTTAASL